MAEMTGILNIIQEKFKDTVGIDEYFHLLYNNLKNSKNIGNHEATLNSLKKFCINYIKNKDAPLFVTIINEAETENIKLVDVINKYNEKYPKDDDNIFIQTIKKLDTSFYNAIKAKSNKIEIKNFLRNDVINCFKDNNNDSEHTYSKGEKIVLKASLTFSDDSDENIEKYILLKDEYGNITTSFGVLYQLILKGLESIENSSYVIFEDYLKEYFYKELLSRYRRRKYFYDNHFDSKMRLGSPESKIYEDFFESAIPNTYTYLDGTTGIVSNKKSLNTTLIKNSYNDDEDIEFEYTSAENNSIKVKITNGYQEKVLCRNKNNFAYVKDFCGTLARKEYLVYIVDVQKTNPEDKEYTILLEPEEQMSLTKGILKIETVEEDFGNNISRNVIKLDGTINEKVNNEIIYTIEDKNITTKPYFSALTDKDFSLDFNNTKAKDIYNTPSFLKTYITYDNNIKLNVTEFSKHNGIEGIKYLYLIIRDKLYKLYNFSVESSCNVSTYYGLTINNDDTKPEKYIEDGNLVYPEEEIVNVDENGNATIEGIEDLTFNPYENSLGNDVEIASKKFEVAAEEKEEVTIKINDDDSSNVSFFVDVDDEKFVIIPRTCCKLYSDLEKDVKYLKKIDAEIISFRY